MKAKISLRSAHVDIGQTNCIPRALTGPIWRRAGIGARRWRHPRAGGRVSGEEVILDDILRFGEAMLALKDETWTVEQILGRGKVHDRSLLDFVHEGKVVGESTQRVKTFIMECWRRVWLRAKKKRLTT
jgi:hypothetical protein